MASPTINRSGDLLDQRSWERAGRSMRCLPFGENLYQDLQLNGLDAATIWRERQRYGRGNRWPSHSEALEDDLRWLITVGVLRREVDGQGLTSRFRLTPLGRDLLANDSTLLTIPPTWPEQLKQALRRRWPF